MKPWKGRNDEESCDCVSAVVCGWEVRLRLLSASVETAGVPRAWQLTMSRGVEERTFTVSDYVSLSNVDDANNWFSLWF